MVGVRSAHACNPISAIPGDRVESGEVSGERGEESGERGKESGERCEER